MAAEEARLLTVMGEYGGATVGELAGEAGFSSHFILLRPPFALFKSWVDIVTCKRR